MRISNVKLIIFLAGITVAGIYAFRTDSVQRVVHGMIRDNPIDATPSINTTAASGHKNETPSAIPPFGDGSFAVSAGASVPCYDGDGKLCGHLKPGALVRVIDTRKSHGNSIAICQLEASTVKRPLVVLTRDLIIRRGDLAQIPADVRALLKQHGRLLADLRQARRQAALRNPYATAYKEATEAYNTLVTDSKRLTSERDEATGAARIRLADQLHMLKNSAPELRQRYEAAKAQYEAWKKEHIDEVDHNPAVEVLQARVAQAAQQLTPYFDS